MLYGGFHRMHRGVSCPLTSTIHGFANDAKTSLGSGILACNRGIGDGGNECSGLHAVAVEHDRTAAQIGKPACRRASGQDVWVAAGGTEYAARHGGARNELKGTWLIRIKGDVAN